MAKKAKSAATSASEVLAKRPRSETADPSKSKVHVFGKKIRCDTDSRGFSTPGNVDLTRLVLHAPNGFVPLWEPNVTLRWRFKPSSMEAFDNPAAIEAKVEELLAKSLLAWGDAVPVKFSKQDDNFDFQIAVRSNDDCDINGCVLASAFFPDAGRHEFVIYPQMFTQSAQEQVETICHELGHTFGLRHFFAQITETGVPSEVFGTHSKFSIMNYGPDSKLTATDKSDLKRLYDEVWSGVRTNINGTPVKLVTPFSANVPTALVSPPPSVAPSQAAYASPMRSLVQELALARARY